jgi:hypothetical protein
LPHFLLFSSSSAAATVRRVKICPPPWPPLRSAGERRRTQPPPPTDHRSISRLGQAISEKREAARRRGGTRSAANTNQHLYFVNIYRADGPQFDESQRTCSFFSETRIVGNEFLRFAANSRQLSSFGAPRPCLPRAPETTGERRYRRIPLIGNSRVLKGSSLPQSPLLSSSNLAAAGRSGATRSPSSRPWRPDAEGRRQGGLPHSRAINEAIRHWSTRSPRGFAAHRSRAGNGRRGAG